MKWISVKERLPRTDGSYLVYLQTTVYSQCFVTTFDSFMMQFPVNNITHWMPLPEPPAE